MSGRDRKRLSEAEAPKEEGKQKAAIPDGDTDGTEQESEKTHDPGRLTNRQMTAGLAALVVLLLVFLLGMRLIDSRKESQTVPERGLPVAGTETEDRTGKIDINSATVEELKALDGIGEAKANAIVEYRKEYGPFTAIEEIKNVKGIGDGIFDAIKDNICV
jgi:competence ComEA-like helix-hairpin-helix protein